MLRKIYRINPEEVREDAAAVFANVHPDDLVRHIEGIRTSARELSPWRDEYRLKFADGTECWLLGNALPELEEDGSILWHGFVTDITERKKIELDILNTRNQLQATLNAVPDVLFELDLEGRFQDYYAHRNEKFSMRAEQLLGKKISTVLPPDAAAICFSALQEAQEQEWSTGKQIQLELANDAYWFELSVAIKPTENEQKPHFIVLSRNITERKKILNLLEQEKTKLNTLIQTIPDLVWLKDEKGIYQFCNQEFECFFGAKQADILGKTDYDFVSREQADFFLKNDARVMSDGIAHTNEEWLVFATNGYAGLFETLKTPLKDSIGKIIGVLGISRNITERKQMELELQRSNADLEQFAYAVSHDMRQPLRMVTSYLGLIETALATQLDDDTRQFLTFAIEGAKRMDSMILSLLDYSRVGRQTDALAIISSRAAVDEAILFLKPALEISGGKVDVSGDWIDLVASRDELTRLFQNLIGNALKYHEEDKPPHVEVSAFVTANTFRVEVRDNGIGINPDQIDRLFKVFSRLQARSRFEGTGVGLALCRKIVEHHGGTIGVKSEGDGLGCIFWFKLPLVTTVS